MDFVKEGKVDEENKKRQAEWERVRKKEDPIGNLIDFKLLFNYIKTIFNYLEAPPEVFDNRSLYEKLKEQHEIKKKEFEDKHALSK